VAGPGARGLVLRIATHAEVAKEVEGKKYYVCGEWDVNITSAWSGKSEVGVDDDGVKTVMDEPSNVKYDWDQKKMRLLLPEPADDPKGDDKSEQKEPHLTTQSLLLRGNGKLVRQKSDHRRQPDENHLQIENDLYEPSHLLSPSWADGNVWAALRAT
jgi:hypothetical protein